VKETVFNRIYIFFSFEIMFIVLSVVFFEPLMIAYE